jgi:type III restriction enzyme
VKLKFKKQQFQLDAVSAAADLFKGQQSAQGIFAVNKLDLIDEARGELFGYGNKLTVTFEQIQENLRAVQERNLLPLTDLTELRFNVEMETGTGKTFVYIKTVYELNKLYGFNKFVVLVPSVAIREGVYHSLQIMQEEFARQYDGKKAHYFIYDSKRRNEVRDFALSSNLEIMVVNIDAIKKSENLFNQESDKMDKTAREFMAECRPILIVDEPQSIDNTEKSRTAIKNLNPLCELRYSATHKEKVNTIYRLTPVDAYQLHIVKQICVASDSVLDGYNKPYIRLLEVGKKSGYYAKIEADVRNPKTGLVERQTKTVGADADLAALTGREIYHGYEIAGIDCTPGFEQIEFANTEFLAVGKTVGGVDETVMKREQIKTTVQLHLEKELRYISRGVKVLSLFFVDEVAKYRDYGAPLQKGVYAKMFEEAYSALIELPRYAAVKEFYKQSAAEVHDGYFSADKKGLLKDTKGDTADDYGTYSLIMKQKERLLSFNTPLRFIFSHSALKEGWDNPNVFQICTLIENRTPFTCRQKIGRGLRLCVDQNGERIDDESINILHVISNESFAEFASKLQTEIEELGVKFGVLDLEMFVNVSYETGSETGEAKGAVISHADATELLAHFRSKNYIDTNGKMKDTLKNDLAQGKVDLPARFEKARERVLQIISAADKKVEIKPYKKQVGVKRKDDLFLSPEFTAIWDKMKQKTIFRMALNIPQLYDNCAEDIAAMDEIKPARIMKEEARLDIEKSGVSFTETRQRFAETVQEFLLPDVIGAVAAECKMPKRSVAEILKKANRYRDFINNPQKFIEAVTTIIMQNKVLVAMEDGIKYSRLEGQEYSWYEVFNIADEKEVFAFLDNNALPARHSVYDHIVYDSKVERDFADSLDADGDVKLFFKIPSRFKISTPIGSYNPDWAVYAENADGKQLFFVIETKGTTDELYLKGAENFKIKCGKKHFEAVGGGIDWKLAKSWSEVRR